MEAQQQGINTSLENLKQVSFTNNPKLLPLALNIKVANVPSAGRPNQYF